MNDDIFTLNGKKSLTIVLDRTGSMEDVIESLRQFLPMYVIRRCAMDIEQMTLVTFDDHYHDPEDLEMCGPTVMAYGPTENLEEYAYWLKTVRLGDGADHPEAIACALAKARALDPDASIWLVTDAVPHGVGFDSEDFEEGCPCGVPLDLINVNVAFVTDKPYINSWDVIQRSWDYWQESGCNSVYISDLSHKLQEEAKELVEA